MMKVKVEWDVKEGEDAPPEFVPVPDYIDRAKIADFLSDTWGFLVIDWEEYKEEAAEEIPEEDISEEEIVYYDLLEDLRVQDLVIQEVRGLHEGSSEVRFVFHDGTEVRMYHTQECCEYVVLEDFEDLKAEDLVGCRIVEFEAATKSGGNLYEEHQWTFYNIRTTGMDVNLRWFGSSNGYYSTSVSVERV